MSGTDVFVVAPVLLIIADNPMCSEICNHLGSGARKYCRMCLVIVTTSSVILCDHVNVFTG